ncbi:MAG: hypothetical protein MJZ11_03580 [Lachnospiraceae bacterium]|nr:hypothetical protein [Lachnospiraceae bacterium]
MSNLLKGYWVSVEDDTRMVDSNNLVEQRVREEEERRARLNLIFGDQNNIDNGDENSEFSAGLQAKNLDALLSDDSATGVILGGNSPGYADGQYEEGQYDEGQSEMSGYENDGFVAADYSSMQPPTNNQSDELVEVRAEIESLRQEAASIIDNANNEAMEIKQRANEEGWQEGYAAGNQSAMEELEAMRSDLERQGREMAEEYERQLSEIEPMLVDKITDIYQHIFKVDFESYRGIIFGLLADAINSSESSSGIIVHISKTDYQMVMENKDDILVETGMTEDRIEFIQDATLNEGGAMIETSNGIFDCSLETELSELKRKLMLLAYQ